jgi:hypothetical protein
LIDKLSGKLSNKSINVNHERGIKEAKIGKLSSHKSHYALKSSIKAQQNSQSILKIPSDERTKVFLLPSRFVIRK